MESHVETEVFTLNKLRNVSSYFDVYSKYINSTSNPSFPGSTAWLRLNE